MTRTYGHKTSGYDKDLRRENACHWVSGWAYVEYGHNVTKYHYTQRQHYGCTKAEVEEIHDRYLRVMDYECIKGKVGKMCERLDAMAMDNEWTRMQDEIEQDTD